MHSVRLKVKVKMKVKVKVEVKVKVKVKYDTIIVLRLGSDDPTATRGSPRCDQGKLVTKNLRVA